MDSFGVGEWMKHPLQKNHRRVIVIISNLNSTEKSFNLKWMKVSKLDALYSIGT